MLLSGSVSDIGQTEMKHAQQVRDSLLMHWKREALLEKVLVLCPGSCRSPRVLGLSEEMLDSWTLLFGHCLLSACLLLCQAKLQRSCSQHINRGAEGCHLLCSCSSYPPVPPPPPPPPPPPGLTAAAPEASAPLPRPWWMEIIVVGTIASALAVFLLLIVIICYKAIKRKPMKKEKNCGEDAMSSFKKTNSAAVGTRSV